METNNRTSISTLDKSIPVLQCRGTHYDVGFSIGHTFKNKITELLATWKYFNDVVLKLGSTDEGKSLTKSCLKLCSNKYPGYIREIKGMADGAGIEFGKLFMLNIDSILCTIKGDDENEEVEKLGGTGCTTVLCNKDEIILGHTEDAFAEIKDHVYIVSAEILNDNDGDENVVLEKFTTFCYAGALMGYTMGFNSNRMIYSVNTIFPTVCTRGTPRAFIARSFLGSPDLPNLLNVLKDKGNGIADGFSLNVYFYPNCDDKNANGNCNAEFYNIEVAPPKHPGDNESVVDIYRIEPGTAYTHCNKYRRIKMNEVNPTAILYSDKRDCAMCHHHTGGEPKSEHCVKEMLSDQSDFNYPIYNAGKKNGEEYKMNFIRTVAAGIFNINHRTWSVYSNAPAENKPETTFYIE